MAVVTWTWLGGARVTVEVGVDESATREEVIDVRDQRCSFTP